MSPPVPGTCSVCTKPAKSLCGGCRRLAFCSQACQKLRWPTHRTQCKSGCSFFVEPALTESEAFFMPYAEVEPFELGMGPARPQLLDLLHQHGFFTNDYLRLIRTLSADARPSKQRSSLLILCRRHLQTSYTPPRRLSRSSPGPEPNPWYSNAGFASCFVDPTLAPSMEAGVDPLEAGQPFLEQVLFAFDVFTGKVGPTPETLKLAVLGFERAQEMLNKLPVRPRPKHVLQEQLSALLEFTEKLERDGV
ncbi:hypothetical protein JCM10207_008525 [Rhodosporidiobolus poonsookiae]